MSLRKGSLKEYYNSILGMKSAGCQAPVPGRKSTCYEDKVGPNTRAKLGLYSKPPQN